MRPPKTDNISYKIYQMNLDLIIIFLMTLKCCFYLYKGNLDSLRNLAAILRVSLYCKSTPLHPICVAKQQNYQYRFFLAAK